MPPITNQRNRVIYLFHLLKCLGVALAVVGNTPSFADPATPPDEPDQPFRLIDRQLNEQLIDLLAIENSTLSYRKQQTVPQQQPIREVLALLRETSPNTNTTANENDPRRNNVWSGPVLTLTDGRAFTGRILEVIDAGESLIWKNDFLGIITTPLEKIREIHLQPNTNPTDEKTAESEAMSGDVVELVNGDQLSGFIAAIDYEKILFETDAGNEITINLARISALKFANETLAPSVNDCWLWLDDGSIVAVETNRLLLRAGALRIVLAGQAEEAWIAFDNIEAIIFNAGALRGLAGIKAVTHLETGNAEQTTQPIGHTWFETPVTTSIEKRCANANRGGSGRRELPNGLADIQYLGPGAVKYALPPGVTRFAAGVEIPRSALDWADLDLIILIDGKEKFRRRFNAEQPTGRLTFTINKGAEELVIRLAEGDHGPVQNTIKLIRPMLLITE